MRCGLDSRDKKICLGIETKTCKKCFSSNAFRERRWRQQLVQVSLEGNLPRVLAIHIGKVKLCNGNKLAEIS